MNFLFFQGLLFGWLQGSDFFEPIDGFKKKPEASETCSE
jgi:hypothetical protein